MNIDFFQLSLIEDVLESNQQYLELLFGEYVSINESNLDLQIQKEIQEGFLESAKNIILKILKSIGNFFKSIVDMVKSFFKGSDKGIGTDNNKEKIDNIYKDIVKLRLKDSEDMPSYTMKTRINLKGSTKVITENLCKGIEGVFESVNSDISSIFQNGFDGISKLYNKGDNDKIQEAICKYFEKSSGISLGSKNFSDMQKSIQKYCNTLNEDSTDINIGIKELDIVYTMRKNLSDHRDKLIKTSEFTLKKIASMEDIIEAYSEKAENSDKIVTLAKSITTSLGSFVSEDLSIIFKTYLNTIKACDSIIISYKNKATTDDNFKQKRKEINGESYFISNNDIEIMIDEITEEEYRLQQIREEKQFMYSISEGYLNQLSMGLKVSKYNKKANTKINGYDDLIKNHGVNPGYIELVKRSNNVEDLQYIRRDNSTAKSQILKIKDRIVECKKVDPKGEVPSYYKFIKERFIDKGITEKDCDKAIEGINNTNKLISDRIKEVKKQQSTKESFSFIEEMKRSELSDNVFGIPSQRKYPMPDKKHVYSAIKLFGHVDEEHEEELARNIKKMMKNYDISPDEVGDKNKLKKYL